MKKYIYMIPAVAAAFVATGCSFYENEVEELRKELDEVTLEHVVPLEKQIEAMLASIYDLEEADTMLKNHIYKLQEQDEILCSLVKSADARIEEVRKELSDSLEDSRQTLRGEIETAGNSLLASLAEYKLSLQARESLMNSSIDSLRRADAALENEIASLKDYADAQSLDFEHWADSSFATLSHKAALESTISSIKSLHSMIDFSLESFSSKVDVDIEKAVSQAGSSLSESLAVEIGNIRKDCNDAISAARTSLEENFSFTLEQKLSELESSIKTWVSERLANYYTISQVEEKIAVMKAEFLLDSLSCVTYLDSLMLVLENSLEERVRLNSESIAALETRMADINDENNAMLVSIMAKRLRNLNDNSSRIAQCSKDAAALSSASLTASNKERLEENTKLIQECRSLLDSLAACYIPTSEDVADTLAKLVYRGTIISGLASDIYENALQISANEETARADSEKIDQLEKDLVSLRSEIESTNKDVVATAINDYKGVLSNPLILKASELEARADAFATDIDDIRTSISQMKSGVDDIKTLMTEAMQDLLNLNARIAALAGQIQSISVASPYADARIEIDATTAEFVAEFDIWPAEAASKLVAELEEIRISDGQEAFSEKVWLSCVGTVLTRASGLSSLSVSRLRYLSNGRVAVHVLTEGLPSSFLDSTEGLSASLRIGNGDYVAASSYFPLIIAKLE